MNGDETGGGGDRDQNLLPLLVWGPSNKTVPVRDRCDDRARRPSRHDATRRDAPIPDPRAEGGRSGSGLQQRMHTRAGAHQLVCVAGWLSRGRVNAPYCLSQYLSAPRALGQ